MKSKVLILGHFAPATAKPESSYPGKIVFDYTGALVLSAMALVLVPIAALVIVLTTGERPFFRQRRVGQDMRYFIIWKLRTMRDGRVTKVGSVLRRYHIDELPQVVHVWSRRMSIVGPRPLWSKEFFDWYGQDPEGYQERQRAKPGLISLVVLMGKAKHLAEKHGATWPLKQDLAYVRNPSLRADTLLVWQTIRKLGGASMFPVAIQEEQEQRELAA